MKKIIVTSILAAVFSVPVMAQSVGAMYGEVAYTKIKANADDLSLSPTAARFTLGTVVDSNVALEGFYAAGMSSDSGTTNVYVTPIKIDAKISNMYGVSIRPFYNLSSDVEIFGRLGYVKSKLEGTASAVVNGRSVSYSNSSSDSSGFYGVGAAFKLNDNLKAVVDYTKLSGSDDSMTSIGLRYNF